MKKNLCKTLALCLVMLMAFSVVAYADASMSRGTPATDGTITISVTGVGPSDEVTLLVVPTGTDLATVTTESIIYIDQTTADTDGNAAFTFATPDGKFDAYSGFTSMTLAQALSDIDKGGDTPDPGTDTPTIDTTKSHIMNDAFDMEGYKRIFVKLTEENGQWMPAHKDADSVIYYSTEREGYDGLIKSDVADLATALTEFTWTKVAPTDEQTIKMYGDLSDDDQAFDIFDISEIQEYMLGIKDFTVKQILTADTAYDGYIDVFDISEIQEVMLGIKERVDISEK